MNLFFRWFNITSIFSCLSCSPTFLVSSFWAKKTFWSKRSENINYLSDFLFWNKFCAGSIISRFWEAFVFMACLLFWAGKGSFNEKDSWLCIFSGSNSWYKLIYMPCFPSYLFFLIIFIHLFILFIFTAVMGAGHAQQNPVSLVLHMTCNLLSTALLFWFNCSIFLLLHLHFQPDVLCPLFFWYNQQIHALFYFAALF